MTLLTAGAVGIIMACIAGFAVRSATAASIAWLLLIEAMPDFWLNQSPGTHEALIALMKAAGIALAFVLAIRNGSKFDQTNPSFAFLFMFAAGLTHGLYPGLTITDSFRSFIGSIAPFIFGFVRLAPPWRRAVIRTIILAPYWSVATGILLQLLGIHPLLDTGEGIIRLAGPGQAPFLAGFALIAIYAGLIELSTRPTRQEFLLLTGNFGILILTGARMPLALALLIAAAAYAIPNPNFTAIPKLALAAAIGALASLAIIFASSLGFVRIVGLAQAGQESNLSNRDLTWPYFQAAIHNSPWVGWGAGAGKVVIPINNPLATLIGTNAAHNEYLRIGSEGGLIGLSLLILLMSLWTWQGSRNLAPPQRQLMRLVLIAFAIHSWTDNTLIATTSSVLFIWVSAVFATAADRSKAAP